MKGRKAVHIGDNQKTDVDMAIGYGIHTYLSPSPWDLLVTSSFLEIWQIMYAVHIVR